VVGGIMGLGATFGALNTMYSMVSARMVEIATLRAIGFGGAAVVVSMLAESLLLAFLGAAIAWIAFNGNFHSGGGMVFRLAVTPGLVGLGGRVCLRPGIHRRPVPGDPRRRPTRHDRLAGRLVRSSSLDLRLSSYMPLGAPHPALPSFRNTHRQVCLCRPNVASSTGGQS
jgi:ABC-type antimicrobial peptide transport system permease subunit